MATGERYLVGSLVLAYGLVGLGIYFVPMSTFEKFMSLFSIGLMIFIGIIAMLPLRILHKKVW